MNEFREAIRAVGLEPPEYIEPGALHRFPGIGKGNGNKAGWCKLFEDGRGGVFGDWAADLNETWQAKRDNPMSANERAEFRREVKAAKEKAEAERKAAQAEAADKAAAIWEAATPAPAEHGYLVAKGIQPHGVRVNDGHLVIPMRDGGNLLSLQIIGADGNKRFLPGGRVTGCYYSIGKPDGIVCIAEGFATAASVHEATGYAVAVAFNAGNLEPVAKSLRQRMPDARIVICGDNDESGTGQDKAAEAATAIKGTVAIPPETGDFNDQAQAHGNEAVRQSIKAATHQAITPGVRLITGSGIHPEPISWVWPGWLAHGKLHIIAGAPGCGKTTIGLAFAATLTSGGRWPDGTRAQPGNVLIWSGEDDPADTLLPRLIGMGADRSRVHFVDVVTDPEGDRQFDPATDMRGLEIAARQIGNVGLVVVDPIVNAVTGDSHKNTETRRALQPVVDLAASLDAAALGISHYTKGTQGRDPIERVTGSIAFGALPRIIMGAAKSETDDGPERLLVRAKSNIGPDGGGFGYELRQSELSGYPGVIASGVYWGETLEGTARALLGVAENTDDEKSAVDDAMEWLADVLDDGRVQTTELQKLAKQAGHSWASVRRAKNTLRVETEREGFGRDGKFYWRLPIGAQHIDAQNSPQDLSTYDKTRATPSFQCPETGENPHRRSTSEGGHLCGNGQDDEGVLTNRGGKNEVAI